MARHKKKSITLYRQGDIGIRIEDDVVVTADGVESLTTFERGLTLVG